jgi:hypothetical protein
MGGHTARRSLDRSNKIYNGKKGKEKCGKENTVVVMKWKARKRKNVGWSMEGIGKGKQNKGGSMEGIESIVKRKER